VDSSGGPGGEGAITHGTWTLTKVTANLYTLSVFIDHQYLDNAQYPVSIDPGSFTINAHKDTWADQSSPDNDYMTNEELKAGQYTSTDNRQSFLKFDVGDYAKSNLVVQSADMYLWPVAANSSTVKVDAKRVTSTWPSPLTWNARPSVNSTVYAQASGPADGTAWYDFGLQSLYQNILDTSVGWTNYGVRLEGHGTATSNYHRFASLETTTSGAQPELIVVTDQLPGVPVLSSPATGVTENTPSPTLAITGLPSDPDKDDVRVDFQVSKSSSSWTGSNLVAESGWTDETSWAVPQGALLYGQTYYWRAESWDVCSGDDGMCDLKGKAQPASGSRSFTMALHHWGEDSRWAMWTDSLGNGVNPARFSQRGQREPVRRRPPRLALHPRGVARPAPVLQLGAGPEQRPGGGLDHRRGRWLADRCHPHRPGRLHRLGEHREDHPGRRRGELLLQDPLQALRGRRHGEQGLLGRLDLGQARREHLHLRRRGPAHGGLPGHGHAGGGPVHLLLQHRGAPEDGHR